MQSGVYQITNEVNGKRYIGSAVNLHKRKKEHFCRLRRGNHPNIHLKRSAKIHGAEAFSFSILVNCPKERVLEWEQIALDGLQPEYNICPTAGNTAGRKHPPRSAEYREKISKAQKGRKKSKEHMDALQRGRNNQVFTEERRKKVSESLKNSYLNGSRSRERPPEYREKIGRTLARLSDDQVRQIRIEIQNKVPYSKLSEKYGVAITTFADIKHGRKYWWVK